MNSTPLLVGNNSTITKNARFHDRTKNINTKYHLIQYHVETKIIYLIRCSTNEKIADIFTKTLRREKLEQFIMMLGLKNTPLD
jgi:hypothetical protein